MENLKITDKLIGLEGYETGQLISEITNSLPEKCELLLITLSGSRGKLLHSSNSDIDVKFVFKHCLRDYILQKISEHQKLNTKNISSIDGKVSLNLEGQGIDLIKAFNLSKSSNMFMSEIIRSPVIYENPKYNVLEELKKSFISLWKPFTEIHSLIGIIISDLYKNNPCKKERTLNPEDFLNITLSYKKLMEAIYNYLQLRILLDMIKTQKVNYFDIFQYSDFLETANIEDEEIRDEIKKIAKERIIRKEEKIQPSQKLLADIFKKIKEGNVILEGEKNKYGNKCKVIVEETVATSEEFMLRIIKAEEN